MSRQAAGIVIGETIRVIHRQAEQQGINAQKWSPGQIKTSHWGAGTTVFYGEWCECVYWWQVQTISPRYVGGESNWASNLARPPSGGLREKVQGPVCNRAPPLGAAPDARRLATPGSTSWSRGWLLRVWPVKLLCESRVENVSRPDPGSLLLAIPLPVNQVLEYTAPAPRVEKFSDLVRLLVLDQNGRRHLSLGFLIHLSLSRTTSGF